MNAIICNIIITHMDFIVHPKSRKILWHLTKEAAGSKMLHVINGRPVYKSNTLYVST